VTVAVEARQSPQQIFFGTEKRANDPAHFVVPIEVIAGVFFTLIAMMFVGLGQAMGRSFNALPNRVAAYTVNVLGSLAGIAVFGAASYLRTPPLLWFAVSTGLAMLCLRRWNDDPGDVRGLPDPPDRPDGLPR